MLDLPGPDDQANVDIRRISVDEARSVDITQNNINPRHESTAALGRLLTDLPAEGGFLSVARADLLVILPPRSMMTRSGEEIDLQALEECQLFRVRIE